jgi:hypothetical protein
MIPSKRIPLESTIYGEGMHLYVREIVCGGRQFGAEGAQNVEPISKEATTNMIISYFKFEHQEQLVMDLDEHSNDIPKEKNV